MDRNALLDHFRRRFSLRLHMTVLLAATTLSGVLTSKAVVATGLAWPLLRYPLIVLVAYGFFFVWVRLWLLVVAKPAVADIAAPDASEAAGSSATTTSWGDLAQGVGRLGGSGRSGWGRRAEPTSLGGGRFGGAGASAALAPAGGAGVSIDPAATASTTAGSEGLLSGAGRAFDKLDSDNPASALFAVAALVLLVVAVLGVGFYVVAQAPMILSDAVFNTLLSTRLAQSSAAPQEGGWARGLLRTTWRPFALVLAAAAACGWAFHHYFPGAAHLGEVLERVGALLNS